MKRIAYLAVALVLGLGSKEVSAKSKVSGYLFRTTGLCASATPSFDLVDVDRLSVVVASSTGTYSNVSYTDGTKSTMSVTVASASYVLVSTPTLQINGVTITYIPVATASGTAKAISDAIMANASLNTLIVSTWTGSVVFSTAIPTGSNPYTITSSSWAALTPAGVIFAGGAASDVTSTTDLITKANTFPAGQGVFLTTTTNVAMGGLTWGTTYFVIPVQPGTSFKLATTLVNASAGTAIDISTGTGGGAFVLNASPYSAGSAGYAWQSSNDNVSWNTIPSISSVTVSGSATTAWDFGNWNYRWLRMNYTGPTRGCVVFDVSIEGKDFN